MANEDQRAAWNGASGENWVRHQERYDRSLEPWAALLAEAAAVAPGERVLDVGCGCGATTLDAARRAAGAEGGGALGVDLSAPMTELARRRAREEGLPAEFRVADAQADDLGAEVHDVVVSRFGAMFFDDPVAAFANIRRAVRPGGRLAFVVWGPQEDQTWLTVPAAAAEAHLPPRPPAVAAGDEPGMFALARPQRAIELLVSAGWSGVGVERHERPVLFAGGGTVEEAVAFLAASGPARTLFAGVDEGTVGRALDAAGEALAEHLTPAGVVLRGAAWLVTAGR